MSDRNTCSLTGRPLVHATCTGPERHQINLWGRPLMAVRGEVVSFWGSPFLCGKCGASVEGRPFA